MPRFTTRADATDPTTALRRASDDLARMVRTTPHGALTSYVGRIQLVTGDGFGRYVAKLDAEYAEPSEPVRGDAWADDPDRTTRRGAFCGEPISRCVEAGEHDPVCRCVLAVGHEGYHLSSRDQLRPGAVHRNAAVMREAARFEVDPRRGLLP